MTAQYVEIARFKTLPEVTDEALLMANEALAAQQKRDVSGFVGRELIRVDRGDWIIVLRMKDEESMKSLLGSLKENLSTEIRAYGALLDRPSMRLEFGHLVAAS